MTVRTFGASKLTTTNNTGKVLRQLASAKKRAAEAMAEEARIQAQEVYYTDGDGEWDRNTEATKAWKGFDAPMAGRTASLSRDIQIRDSETKPGVKNIGWFEDPHPDTEGRLSMGALAAIHEFGNPSNMYFGLPAPIPERRWLSRVESNPSREAAVYNAGRKEYGL